MTLGKVQVLWWPRPTLFFYQPRGRARDYDLYRYIYHWIVYVWPVEIRKFR